MNYLNSRGSIDSNSDTKRRKRKEGDYEVGLRDIFDCINWSDRSDRRDRTQDCMKLLNLLQKYHETHNLSTDCELNHNQKKKLCLISLQTLLVILLKLVESCRQRDRDNRISLRSHLSNVETKFIKEFVLAHTDHIPPERYVSHSR